MKRILTLILIASILPLCALAQGNKDESKKSWANYERYYEANKNAETPVAVFMGNSITQNWASMRPDFFTENNFLGRGISGQVTAQMLARFRQDVINLHPKVVVIMAGTNDIALNQQYVPIEGIAGNIISMCELANAHGIKVLLLPCLPVYKYGWRPEVTDAPEQIGKLNSILETYAMMNGIEFLDLHTLMKDERGGLPEKYSKDGVHPTVEGYALIEPLVKERILRLSGN